MSEASKKSGAGGPPDDPLMAEGQPEAEEPAEATGEEVHPDPAAEAPPSAIGEPVPPSDPGGGILPVEEAPEEEQEVIDVDIPQHLHDAGRRIAQVEQESLIRSSRGEGEKARPAPIAAPVAFNHPAARDATPPAGETTAQRAARGVGRMYTLEDFYAMFRRAYAVSASDLHVKSGAKPKIRKDRILAHVDPQDFNEPVDSAAILEFYRHARGLTDGHEDALASKGTDDFHLVHENMLIRANITREYNGPKLSFRFFYRQYASLDKMSLQPLKEHLSMPSGLILLTGPMGSGKTTAGAACLEYINETRACHIGTIEDPIEYLIEESMATVSQRSVPEDLPSFDAGLRSMLRQDIDVIFVGEMREPAVIRSAVSMADAGQLVIATFHARTVEATFTRIIGAYPAQEQQLVREILAGMPIIVVNMRLVPLAKGGVAVAYELFHHITSTRAGLRSNDFSNWDHAMRSTKTMVSWESRLQALRSQLAPKVYDRLVKKLGPDGT